MLAAFPVAVIIGAALGFLAGLGVGGGSLLILWLTLILKMQYTDARVLNLIFFLPSAIIACIFRLKQGNLPVKKILPAMLIGCVTAAVCSWIGTHINTEYLQKFFGALLLITGIREILYKPKQKETGQA